MLIHLNKILKINCVIAIAIRAAIKNGNGNSKNATNFSIVEWDKYDPKGKGMKIAWSNGSR